MAEKILKIWNVLFTGDKTLLRLHNALIDCPELSDPPEDVCDFEPSWPW